MQHLDEGTIHAWLDGALSQSESDDITHHVAECAACAERVAEARGVMAGASRIVSSLDVVRGNVIPARTAAPKSLWRRLHLTPGRAALAASILVAASAILSVRHDTMQQPVVHETAVEHAMPSSAPAAAASAPRTETAAAIPRTRRRSRQAASAATAPTPSSAPVVAQQLDQVVAAPSPAKVAPAGAGAQTTMRLRAMPLVENANLCYQVAPDSAQRIKNLPERFALEHDDAGKNVVRSVTPDGRIDSVLVGSEWQNRPPQVVVRFATPTPVTLSFMSNAMHGQASSGAENRTVLVRRADCRQ